MYDFLIIFDVRLFGQSVFEISFYGLRHVLTERLERIFCFMILS